MVPPRILVSRNNTDKSWDFGPFNVGMVPPRIVSLRNNKDKSLKATRCWGKERCRNHTSVVDIQFQQKVKYWLQTSRWKVRKRKNLRFRPGNGNRSLRLQQMMIRHLQSTHLLLHFIDATSRSRYKSQGRVYTSWAPSLWKSYSHSLAKLGIGKPCTLMPLSQVVLVLHVLLI